MKGWAVVQMTTDDSYRRNRMSAADEVVKDIRAQILSRRLERGVRLPSEKELATQYDVSAPTIREAIRALSATSLVESRHGSGTFVTADGSALMSSALSAVIELEEVDLLSILDVSEALYLRAVTLAVDVATDDELLSLREAAEALRETLRPAEFAPALRDFLDRLVELSHNKLLISIATFLIESQITLARGAAETRPETWEEIGGHLIDERIAIVDALRGRDAALAQSAVVAYMRRGAELVREHAS
jgi:GntR family transcriptional repressor for pyruvate dehydrogenase complex